MAQKYSSAIPPTQLVDRSYSAYTDGNAQLPESHQRSWWIVHTRPTRTGTRSSPNPTNALVDCVPPSCNVAQATSSLESHVGRRFVRLSMNDPPTALVGL